MTICGAILIFSALVVGFCFLQGTGIASRNLGRTPQLVKKKIHRAGRTYLLWLLIVCMIGESQVLMNFKEMPPRLLIFLIVALLGAVIIAFSKLGKDLVKGLPITYIVGFQAFRILPELALFAAYEEGLAPIQMTWLGMNHDILTSATAIVLAFMFKKHVSRPILTAWNILGLLLLLKIVVIAMLSTPSPLRYFTNEPASTFIAHMPYILLPGVLVPCALLGHLLIFRWLWKK